MNLNRPVPLALALVLALAACAAPLQKPALLVTGPDVQAAHEPAVWLWQETLMADGTRWAPAAPQNYTLRFLGDGKLEVRADCNRGPGKYRAHADGGMLIGAFATTRMACPKGSLERVYLRDLENVSRFAVGDGGELWLTLARGAGTMRFTAVSR